MLSKKGEIRSESKVQEQPSAWGIYAQVAFEGLRMFRQVEDFEK